MTAVIFRRHKMAAALAASIAALILAPAIAAATLPTEAVKLAASIDVARAAWPGLACPADVVVGPEADHELNLTAAALGYHVLGEAKRETCTAYVRSGLQPSAFCAVLVHELGHLAGLEHSDAAAAPIMGEGSDADDWPPCLPLDAALRDPVAEMRATIHHDHPGTTIRTKRYGPRHVRFWVLARGRVIARVAGDIDRDLQWSMSSVTR